MPNRSARVAPIDLQTLDASFEALNLSQRAIVRWAAIRHTRAHLRPIRAAMEAVEAAGARRDPAAMTDRNCDFHLAIAAGKDRRQPGRKGSESHLACATRQGSAIAGL